MVLLLLIFLLAGISGTCAAETASTPPAGVGSDAQMDTRITLDFDDAAVPLVADFFEQETGMHHVVESGARVDHIHLVYVEHPISVEEAHRMFISTLKALGYKVSIEGNTI